MKNMYRYVSNLIQGNNKVHCKCNFTIPSGHILTYMYTGVLNFKMTLYNINKVILYPC